MEKDVSYHMCDREETDPFAEHCKYIKMAHMS